ncbi:MAG TPA: hypothetical protein VH394_26075 [Thermoanaerobaculia bacterium]|jgi:hypothetical protein|nr:hypothetical protein [Thermoanaerobaculia bacterium]
MEINAAANLTIQTSGGPAVSAAWTIEADLFDRAIVKIPKNITSLAVPLQPAGGDKILLLLITASKYTSDLTYKLNGDEFKLTQVQILSGPDLVKKLSATPTNVTFKNVSTEDITVDVFVLRKA